MTVLFPCSIVVLFSFASLICFVGGETGKGWFYLLSAAINVNIMFLK